MTITQLCRPVSYEWCNLWHGQCLECDWLSGLVEDVHGHDRTLAHLGRLSAECGDTHVLIRCKPARLTTLFARSKNDVIWICYMLWSSNSQGISKNYHSFWIHKVKEKSVFNFMKTRFDWERLGFDKYRIFSLKSNFWSFVCAGEQRRLFFPPNTEQNIEKRFRTRLTAHSVNLSGVASGRIFAIFLSSAVSAVSCNRRQGTFEGRLQSRI